MCTKGCGTICLSLFMFNLFFNWSSGYWKQGIGLDFVRFQGGIDVDHLPDILEEAIRGIAPQLFGPVFPILPDASTVVCEESTNEPSNKRPLSMEVGVTVCVDTLCSVAHGKWALCCYVQDDDVEQEGGGVDNVAGPTTKRSLLPVMYDDGDDELDNFILEDVALDEFVPDAEPVQQILAMEDLFDEIPAASQSADAFWDKLFAAGAQLLPFDDFQVGTVFGCKWGR